VVHALTDDQLRLLIHACQGKSLRDRRDEAILRLMAETGMRAGEVIGLTVADVDLHQGLVTVRRGKGGKGRVCGDGPPAGVEGQVVTDVVVGSAGFGAVDLADL
jgi:integrase